MLWLSCSTAHVILVPQPGIEPESPPWQGRCLTSGPQGKSLYGYFKSMVFTLGLFCLLGNIWQCLNAGDARDTGSMPGPGRSPGEGSSNPLQYSCLGNPMDRGACWLQSMGSQRVRHDLVTEQQHQKLSILHRAQLEVISL